MPLINTIRKYYCILIRVDLDFIRLQNVDRDPVVVYSFSLFVRKPIENSVTQSHHAEKKLK